MILDILQDFFRQHKNTTIIYFLCSLSTPIIDVLLPHFYGNFVESIKNTGGASNIKPIIGLWITAAILNYYITKLDSYIIPTLHVFVIDYITNISY